MISSLTWIRKGIALENPIQNVVDLYESGEYNPLAAPEDSEEQNKENQGLDSTARINADNGEIDEFDMENYDNEPDYPTIFTNSQEDLDMDHVENNLDNDNDEDDLEDELEEIEQLKILPTDNLLVVAKADAEEVSTIEVCVYESSEQNLYVHHDFFVDAYPLCLEWLTNSQLGNLLAVGTFGSPLLDPNSADATNKYSMTHHEQPYTQPYDVNIWDLNVIDSYNYAPVLSLIDPNYKVGSTTADTMSLSWNTNVMNLLASGSSDALVRIWDLHSSSSASGNLVSRLTHHKDKVQCVKWHPVESSILLTASYDKTIAICDSRASMSSAVIKFAKNLGDVETLLWDIHNPSSFYASFESGVVHCYDIRTLSSSSTSAATSPKFTIDAHKSGCTALDVHPTIPNCLLTASVDKSLKIWNTSTHTLVAKSDSDHFSSTVGAIFSAKFCPDSPYFEIAVGGDQNSLLVLDLSSNASIQSAFNYSPPIESSEDNTQQTIRDPFVYVNSGGYGSD
ncbi:putative WD repeat-containing protein [Zancudomyces culisetae]|uniref:Putative WD repeat-containing protein n=1 Tax=Zancudomyces culisetae TaxID=1213189 RepID=A0A1R1PRZ5_ZANCU|nr:putative WD repeat-containing protein [Zancudomyces culisetae]|eukprot:OMH83662.1 putative WD repeat-containing protein [Zancudomyces culisetae]